MANNYSKYSISLDVSTTNVGVALWNESGKLIELKHLELKIAKDILPLPRTWYLVIPKGPLKCERQQGDLLYIFLSLFFFLLFLSVMF